MKINSPVQQLTSPTAKQTSEAGKTPKESLGDIGNRVANSGKVGGGRAVQGQGNPKLDKDAFFKLMLTHLKNQDPTSPLKSHEMAAQLAQFSSLEQMSNINEVLKDMNKGQANNGQFQALDLIGKTVSGDSAKIDHKAGDTKHSIHFNLADAADEVKIAIKDAEGNVVKNFEMKSQPKGSVKLEWDGKSLDGKTQAAGTYKVHVDAKKSTGSKVAAETQFKGQVTGVQLSETGPIVFIGNKSVPLKEIKQISMEETNKSSNSQMAEAAKATAEAPAMAALSNPAPMGGAGLPASLASFMNKK
ncbi:flagellar biosynthesis protein FlgD [bacterium]|nr:flagellar biosynthesis protein FlgD [bacterium]